jgi:predicted naringenin-chalcone synthase
MPGAETRVASILGLDPSVRTTMLYVNGCSSAATMLRLAKDMAENNRRARVLVVCAEITLMMFRAPHEDHIDTTITQALLGDGAGAVIVGADPEDSVERPLFEIVAATKRVIPETTHAAIGQFTEDGFRFYPSTEIPALIGESIEQCLVDALGPLGFSGGWNDLFWAVHPGGRAILDRVEEALQLEPKKMAASRYVLSEYGNMSGPSVIFVLDEIRRRHDEHHGLGVMMGIGPGVCVETMVLHASNTSRTYPAAL